MRWLAYNDLRGGMCSIQDGFGIGIRYILEESVWVEFVVGRGQANETFDVCGGVAVNVGEVGSG